MRYFLDTEFNGFGGRLISLALVPEHGDQEFYASVHMDDPLHPWVEQHVMPYLRHVPPGVDNHLSRENAAEQISAYLSGDTDPWIIADWPDDIAQFCTLLMTGPGNMVTLRTTVRFELVNAAGFSSAATSRVPHNALHDARALRDFMLGDSYFDLGA